MVGEVYAAALEPDALQRMSNVIQAALDVDSVGIWLTCRGQIQDMAVTSDLTESAAPYLAYYRGIDPWTISYAEHPNKVMIGYEIYPETELVKTEFYNDFARKYDLFRPMGSVMDLGPDLLASVSVCRNSPRNLLESRDKGVVHDLTLHVRRALQTRLRFQSKSSGWHTAAFDRFAFGIVVCEAFGRVLYANAAALALDATKSGLTIHGSSPKIGALVPREAAVLSRLVFEAASGQGTRGGAVRLTGGSGRKMSAFVTPLPPEVDDEFGAGRVMVSVQREDAVPSPSAAMLRSIYGLSQAQTELCRALAAGRTFEDIASERGVAVSTMRTHFANLLSRTGTKNLRDLLRLLGTLPPVC